MGVTPRAAVKLVIGVAKTRHMGRALCVLTLLGMLK